MRIVKIVRKESTKEFVNLEITFEKKVWFKTKTFTKDCIYNQSYKQLKYCDTNEMVYIGSWIIESVIQFVESNKEEITFK